jgi:hypothetical protein
MNAIHCALPIALTILALRAKPEARLDVGTLVQRLTFASKKKCDSGSLKGRGLRSGTNIRLIAL